jgi:hypothetical protein
MSPPGMLITCGFFRWLNDRVVPLADSGLLNLNVSYWEIRPSEIIAQGRLCAAHNGQFKSLGRGHFVRLHAFVM